ncbi:tetratricopeptide repeat protein [Marinomonas pollencensis]|uniref:Cytochrome c-type biogenesis protein CcmH n=1 Tax=Marinomonas pollencensis TaxID=491954 RepID=A0A3E0DK19_9GAMM|nr:hypothetical protein [Marinomonas pollencensis]REG82968.1 cytochrome c-type biogenesis protein CcmH [Marinomonas pollencensis]
MMLLWLVMALMIAASLLFFFVYLQKSLQQNSDENPLNFIAARTSEIAQEQEIGRLTGQEAGVLLHDLEEEKTFSSAKAQGDSGHGAGAKKSPLTRYFLLGVFACVALGSVSLYQSLGYSKEVLFSQALAAKTNTPKMTLDFLKYRSERYDRAEDWYYLANDLMSLEQYPQAMAAFKKALVKLPVGSADQAEVMVRYAQAIFYNNGNVSSPAMIALVDKVLALEPKNATALGLKGVAAFDQQAYLEAVLNWQAAARYNENASERQTLLAAIQNARQAGGISYQQVPALVTQQIALRVVWDKSKIQWQADDVLLVYALASGDRMPIAIRRVYPEELNRPIILTNLDNLMSKQSLADAKNVTLVVKLSKITAKDLTKGQVIGIKKDVPLNTRAIYPINVTL